MTDRAPAIVVGEVGPTRVAVREIRENAWRALTVAGFSPGEATVAAEAVALSEIHFSSGLELVTEAMNRVDGRNRADGRDEPIRVRSGRPRLVDAAPGWGLLRLAPPIIGLLMAERPDPEPVLLADHRWHPVMVGFLLAEAAQPHGAEPDLSIAVGPDGAGGSTPLARLRDGVVRLDPDAIARTDRDGLLLAAGQPLSHGVEPDPNLTRRAERDGLLVSAERWQPVDQAAKAYLVPD